MHKLFPVFCTLNGLQRTESGGLTAFPSLLACTPSYDNVAASALMLTDLHSQTHGSGMVLVHWFKPLFFDESSFHIYVDTMADFIVENLQLAVLRCSTNRHPSRGAR